MQAFITFHFRSLFMDVTSSLAISWNHLSTEQKEQGIHPNDLGRLQFNLQGQDISERVSKQLQRFFWGCRSAATDTEFLSKSIHILNASEPYMQPIKAIASQILFTPKPKDRLLEGLGEDIDSIHFEDEYGPLLRKSKNSFAKLYNQLVSESKSHLMHPARRTELIAYISPLTAQAELAADRLIAYRCFGSKGLTIFECKRCLNDHTVQIAAVEQELKTVFDQGPSLITKPDMLQAEALDCIPQIYCRKHVCVAFQYLTEQNKLSILDLPDEKLYVNHIKHCIHPDLSQFLKNYNNETSGAQCHYGIIIKYLKALRNSDLNDLKTLCLNEELTRLQWLKNYTSKRLDEVEMDYQIQLQHYGQDPEVYKPGDFSFINNALTEHILSDAYKAVDKLKVWAFFDEEPPKNQSYMFWKHSTLQLITKELTTNHDGYSFGFTMRWMQRIRHVGWKKAVSDCLEENTKELGCLNKAKL